MKAAREIYRKMQNSGYEESIKLLQGLKGHELADVMHYAKGREEGPFRDQVRIMVLMVAGRRHLDKQATKAAKRKVRKIL